jgi:hypothetical protein
LSQRPGSLVAVDGDGLHTPPIGRRTSRMSQTTHTPRMGWRPATLRP